MAVIQGGNVIPDAENRIWRNAGAPTNGTSGTFAGAAQPGDLMIDTTNKVVYMNMNTLASPTWNSFSDASMLATLADSSTVGGIPLIIRVDVPAGATGNVDVTPLASKIRVINAWLVKNANAGGGAGTITVNNGATAITDAMSINVAAKTVVRCATIDMAQWEIAAAGTLRIVRTRSASTDEGCTVFVEGIHVP